MTQNTKREVGFPGGELLTVCVAADVLERDEAVISQMGRAGSGALLDPVQRPVTESWRGRGGSVPAVRESSSFWSLEIPLASMRTCLC